MRGAALDMMRGDFDLPLGFLAILDQDRSRPAERERLIRRDLRQVVRVAASSEATVIVRKAKQSGVRLSLIRRMVRKCAGCGNKGRNDRRWERIDRPSRGRNGCSAALTRNKRLSD